jgi:NADPH:quinone reductase-like Zn-dependent oxidoreductase
MPIAANAFWVLSPGRGALCRQELLPPGPGQVLVRALCSGISRGTESLVFQGGVPPELADAMACPMQEGGFPGPVKYGYALVGVVEAGPGRLIGKRVFALHPHQDICLIDADACRPVPAAVPDRRATLAANMETALNILWDGGAGPGQRIAIVGAGIVGCLAARLAARLPGVDLTLVDIDPARADIAAHLGAGFALPGDCQPLAGACDLVVHCSASADGLATALTLAGTEATVVEASWYGSQPVMAPLGGVFHPRRLRLVSSQVGMVANSQRPRWSHLRRLDKALQLLDDPTLDRLLGPEIPFADLPAAMAELSIGRDYPPGCPVVIYPSMASQDAPCIP